MFLERNKLKFHCIFIKIRIGGKYLIFYCSFHDILLPGCVVQSVMCLATDACLTADPGVASLIPARSHTFVKLDHEIISSVILLPSADPFKKGCCLSVTSESMCTNYL